jgi:predicted  nucleic acid-binding Zn-ribbon protein
MSGGPSVSIPSWMDSASEAWQAIISLNRKSKKAEIFNAQQKFAAFENEVRPLVEERSRLRSKLTELVLEFPDLAREIGEKQTAIDRARRGQSKFERCPHQDCPRKPIGSAA